MPIYTYQTPEGPVDEIRPSEKRDEGPHPRVWSSFHVPSGCPDPDSSDQGAKRFYRERELAGGRWDSSFSKDKIKKIWGW